MNANLAFLTASLLSLTACVTPTLSSAPPGAAQEAAAMTETAYRFEPRSGEAVDAYRGVFSVPENRADPASRTIEVHYLRFPATGANPGAPIVYLAGGPGGSGVETARGRRFPLFMAMREFGDVIALDQRGTGWSKAAPECPLADPPPLDRYIPRDEAIAALRANAERCGEFWREAGFDPAGYTTVESARDIDDLRAHLGADKVTLWGISYGTHLALAAAREMGPRIDKMILASAEGLDQTVKLPSRTDAYFARLQAAVDAQPAAKAAYPDITAMMRRVHAGLDASPVMLELPVESGPVDFLLTRDVMQQIASASIADPDSAAQMLQLYLAVDNGVYEPVAAVLARYLPYIASTSLDLMPLAMDVASGIGEARLAQVEREAETALLGDTLNFPMPQLAGALGLDLGDDFRRAPRGDMPVLLLSGTLDGRTYPESQREAVAGLSSVSTVTIENAGHNLFMVSPAVTEVIEAFMRGEPVGDRALAIEAPDFAPAR